MAQVLPFTAWQRIVDAPPAAALLPPCHEEALAAALLTKTSDVAGLSLTGGAIGLPDDLLRPLADSGLFLYELRCGSDAAVRCCHSGVIARVRLEDFSAGVVLSHERSRPTDVAEEFAALRDRALQTQIPVALYSDTCCVLEALSAAEKQRPPLAEYACGPQLRCRLWQVSDAAFISRVRAVFDRKSLLLASGQAFYEAALRYRDQLRLQQGDYSGREGFNYLMLALTNLDQLGVHLRPGHRLLQSGLLSDLPLLLGRLGAWFDVEDWPVNAACPSDQQRLLRRLAEQAGTAPAFLLYAGGDRAYRLALQAERLEGLELGAPRINELCLAGVFERLVVEQALGFEPLALDDFDRLPPCLSAAAAFAAVRQGRYVAAFLFAPPAILSLREQARAQVKLPPASTFVCPPFPSRLLACPLDATPVATC
ncbi:DUF1015 family protein [Desulfuromonas thiophila]|jgi:hypothetical protein|uniref:Uncharacterized conserved protein, DUF1015 family n=1 Tax=Desulfuromonas thiophila TaxID=57664 RepID=A0A1G7AU64_9BACT|nr:DUF1015 family protein [Desulfuromonas thiophila]SDE18408.1 Uncharacterized conserved protein, DUF1015 family [Desulfuromonas thiophila]